AFVARDRGERQAGHGGWCPGDAGAHRGGGHVRRLQAVEGRLEVVLHPGLEPLRRGASAPRAVVPAECGVEALVVLLAAEDAGAARIVAVARTRVAPSRPADVEQSQV